jgi:hypothetical protein
MPSKNPRRGRRSAAAMAATTALLIVSGLPVIAAADQGARPSQIHAQIHAQVRNTA